MTTFDKSALQPINDRIYEVLDECGWKPDCNEWDTEEERLAIAVGDAIKSVLKDVEADIVSQWFGDPSNYYYGAI